MANKAGLAGLVSGLLALICSAVSLGIPYWQDVNSDGTTGNHGLFRYTFQTSGVETSGDYLDCVSGSKQTSLKAVRGLVISGTSSLFLATVTVLLFLCCLQRRCIGLLAAVACFLSAGSHTAAVVVFRIKLQIGGDSKFHAGFYLASAAAIISTVAAGLLLKARATADRKIRQISSGSEPSDNRGTSKGHLSIVVFGILFGVLAIVCSAVAIGIPYWQDLDTDTKTGHHGLFRYTFTVSGTEKSGDYLNCVSGEDATYLKAVRGLMICGTCFLCLATVVMIAFLRSKIKWRVGFIGVASCFLSVMVHITALVIFRVKLQGGGNSSYHAGFYLAIAAAVTSFVSGILVLVGAIRTRVKVQDKSENRADITNIPRSGTQRKDDTTSRASDAQRDRQAKEREPARPVEVDPFCPTVYSKIASGGLLVGFLAFSSSVISLGLPYWQHLDTGEATGNHGLFRYTVTTSGMKTSGNYEDLLTETEEKYLNTVRGLAISGSSFLLLALISTLVFICSKKAHPYRGVIGSVFCFLSVASYVAAVVIFGVKLKGEGDSCFHAGFYLAISAGGLGLFAGIIILVAALNEWLNGTEEAVSDTKDENANDKKPEAEVTRENPTTQELVNESATNTAAVNETPAPVTAAVAGHQDNVNNDMDNSDTKQNDNDGEAEAKKEQIIKKTIPRVEVDEMSVPVVTARPPKANRQIDDLVIVQHKRKVWQRTKQLGLMT